MNTTDLTQDTYWGNCFRSPTQAYQKHLAESLATLGLLSALMVD